MRQNGDPLQWGAVAQLNGLIDPWINERADIEIPPVFPTGAQTGILLVTPGGATAVPPPTPDLPGPAFFYRLSLNNLQDFRNLLGL